MNVETFLFLTHSLDNMFCFSFRHNPQQKYLHVNRKRIEGKENAEHSVVTKTILELLSAASIADDFERIFIL